MTETKFKNTLIVNSDKTYAYFNNSGMLVDISEMYKNNNSIRR